MPAASSPQSIPLQQDTSERPRAMPRAMQATGLTLLTSPTLRTLAGFCLLAVTAVQFLLLVQLEQQSVSASASDLAMLGVYGLTLLLAVTVMIDIAWFSAVVRAQAGAARDGNGPA